MRARNIKPGFYRDADLAECSIAARYLVPGLWMMADCNGRLKDNPKQIKMELCPCDDIDINNALDELQNIGQHILRYEISGKKYIQINNFASHQNPHKNEASSEIPEPVGQLLDGSSNYASNPADSLIPDSLIPEKTSSSSDDDLFDAFWSEYPKKVGKDDARKAWKKIKRKKETLGDIKQALSWQKVSDQWLRDKGQFIPNPATYLNRSHWEDEPPEDSSPPPAETPEQTANRVRLEQEAMRRINAS